MSLTWIFLDGIWFSSLTSLLLAVVLCTVGRCSGSWVVLGLFCLVRVKHSRYNNAPQICYPMHLQKLTPVASILKMAADSVDGNQQ